VVILSDRLVDELLLLGAGDSMVGAWELVCEEVERRSAVEPRTALDDVRTPHVRDNDVIVERRWRRDLDHAFQAGLDDKQLQRPLIAGFAKRFGLRLEVDVVRVDDGRFILLLIFRPHHLLLPIIICGVALDIVGNGRRFRR
jgi:hypothetical protein